MVHGHPKKPGSKTDKPKGTVIKCFPTKKEADAMHKAIMANEVIPFEDRPESEQAQIEEYNRTISSEDWKADYEQGIDHWAEEIDPSPLAKRLVEDLEDIGNKDANILEIGIGNGRDSIFFAKKGYRVFGIDIVQKAIEKANELLSKSPEYRDLIVSFVVGDVENLQIEDARFDAVYSVAVLHSTSIAFTFKEIFRLLKPEGIAKLFLYTSTKVGIHWASYWTPGEIKYYAKEAGFEIVEFYEKNDTEPIEIPGVQGEVEQETNIAIMTFKKPKEETMLSLQILDAVKINMPLRKEMFEDREHLVAPVVAIVEGVHNGLYYPEEEIGKFAEAWNGIPLLVGHPKDVDGHSVSANTPEIIEENAVGRFFNVYMEEGKLKGEIWLDVKKAKEVNPAVLDIINGDGQLEVSTGLWTEDENTSGEWKGEKYEAIMRGHRPDHLALLPGGEGACNWEDGCGVRLNTKEGGDTLERNELFEKLEEEGKKSGEAPSKFKLMFIRLANKIGFNILEVSHNDIRNRLEDLIGGGPMEIGGKGPYRYVSNVFDDYFIYEEHAEGKDSKLLKQSYRVKTNDEIELLDEAVEVRRKVTYEEIKTLEAKEVKTMADKDCCKELIDALIANEAVSFSEDDRKWLETLEEDQLKKFEPVVNEEAVAKAKTDQELALQAAKEEGVAEGKAFKDNEPDPKPKEKLDPKPKEEPQTPEQFIANAPEGIRETLDRSYKRDQNLKADLIKGLLENARNTFTKEQLETKNMDELEALAKLGDVPADYSGRGGAPVENKVKDNEKHEDGSGVPDMPAVEWGEAKAV